MSKCKAMVHRPFAGYGRPEYSRCCSSSYKDGYCWSHHPKESVARKRRNRKAVKVEKEEIYGEISSIIAKTVAEYLCSKKGATEVRRLLRLEHSKKSPRTYRLSRGKRNEVKS